MTQPVNPIDQALDYYAKSFRKTAGLTREIAPKSAVDASIIEACASTYEQCAESIDRREHLL